MTHQIFTILVQFNDQSSREVQIKDIDHKLIPVHLTSLFGGECQGGQHGGGSPCSTTGDRARGGGLA